MTTRKTLKDFLAANFPNTTNSISYGIDSSLSGEEDKVDEGDDLGIDPNTGQTLLKRDGLLGNYLKHITDNDNNYHKFKPGNEEHIVTKRGQELYDSDNHGTETVFVGQDHHAYSTLSEYSNSGQMDEGGAAEFTVSDGIDKIGQNNQGSNNLLSDIEGTSLTNTNRVHVNSPAEPTIAQSLSYQLIKNSRFNANSEDSSFKPDGTDSVQFESNENINNPERVQGTFKMSNKFGEYQKEGSRGKLSLDSLKSIGTSILLKAGGWDKSSNPGSSIDTRSLNLESTTKSIYENNNISSLTDNLLVDNEKLRSRNASGAPENSRTGESMRKGRGDYAASIDKSQSIFYN
jgi:hypothetical protein